MVSSSLERGLNRVPAGQMREQIIGEALHRLEKIDAERLSVKIPEYRKIIGFRNLVAHGYDIIDDAALWDLAQNHVPDLLRKLERY